VWEDTSHTRFFLPFSFEEKGTQGMRSSLPHDWPADSARSTLRISTSKRQLNVAGPRQATLDR